MPIIPQAIVNTEVPDLTSMLAPASTYMLRVTSAEIKERKKTAGTILEVHLAIEQPGTDVHGVEIRDWLSIPTQEEMEKEVRKNREGQAVTVGHFMLSNLQRFFASLGASMDTDTNELIGRNCTAEVGVEPLPPNEQNPDGRDINRIENYL